MLFVTSPRDDLHSSACILKSGECKKKRKIEASAVVENRPVGVSFDRSREHFFALPCVVCEFARSGENFLRAAPTCNAVWSHLLGLRRSKSPLDRGRYGGTGIPRLSQASCTSPPRLLVFVFQGAAGRWEGSRGPSGPLSR